MRCNADCLACSGARLRRFGREGEGPAAPLVVQLLPLARTTRSPTTTNVRGPAPTHENLGATCFLALPAARPSCRSPGLFLQTFAVHLHCGENIRPITPSGSTFGRQEESYKAVLLSVLRRSRTPTLLRWHCGQNKCSVLLVLQEAWPSSRASKRIKMTVRGNSSALAFYGGTVGIVSEAQARDMLAKHASRTSTPAFWHTCPACKLLPGAARGCRQPQKPGWEP